MQRICLQCEKGYDDADQSTIFPHEAFRTPEMKKQWQLGRTIVGKKMRFGHMPPGSGSYCFSLASDGMVGIVGFPGEFAPHLFVEDEGAMPGEHATKEDKASG